MSKSLVIVESPTKARTINRFLGKDVEVLACMGHIRDLPQRTMGVEIAKAFEPTYVLTNNGRKVVQTLKRAASQADNIYLATDQDREGEAIAWHLLEILKKGTKATFHRATFHEITQSAIKEAFDHPGTLDMGKVDAQQARRILDRLVGYKISPLLWKHIRKGTSAGRVQSVALRLVCERERAVQDFTPTEYWSLIAALLPAGMVQPFEAKLIKLDNAKPEIPDAAAANALADELRPASFQIEAQRKKAKTQRPGPPFITSTLQQAAGARLRFGTQQTMRLAQQLYEGVELGSGATGLITYMRTDSVAVAKEAQEGARAFIGETYGKEYVPGRPNLYRSSNSAQGAHEAIRPTDVTRTPDRVAPHLNRQQLLLYRLIWTRFVASQMAPAQLEEHSIDVTPSGAPLKHDYLFRATALSTVFPGFMRMFKATEDKSASALEGSKPCPAPKLPELQKGTPCALQDLLQKQHFTEPPKRFTEATLVRELEAKGVGRPSTYATIVHTVQQREYVSKERGALIPTDLGFHVNDYLVGNMPDLFQVGFTAEMESQLDQIEGGELATEAMLSAFYDKFRGWVGGVEMMPAPATDVARELVGVFPDGMAWAEPVKRGRQTYDDHKFFASLKSQLDDGKALSDKQWQALLGLAVRYAEQLPDLRDLSASIGMEKEVEALLLEREKRAADGPAASTQDGAPVTDDVRAFLDALNQVGTWQEPVKRGKRVYDDKAFHASLREQVDGGRKLSFAQEKALQKLTVKYREQVGGFAELAEKYQLDIPADKAYVEGPEIESLVALVDSVTEWDAPTKVRGRTYDDQAFATSLQRQFTESKRLSDRQVQALKKILAKYHAQLADFESVRTTHDLPSPTQPKKAVEKTDQECPTCGAPLVKRQSRRGTFFGCSTFPKCRYTKPDKA